MRSMQWYLNNEYIKDKKKTNEERIRPTIGIVEV